ncbi:HalD/BesD family halogenase [Vreelandella arcis]|uniref:Fe2OG dioxygenase domain-containing protein n=1 Tax=Vreelandella arcis TaxID=416873 RepID=A0A1H0BDN9_9GAMM|nr:hypothetical protein [Halomonas arcis]SDN43782.1 hypothetical protein SAMN04487951_10552 [Halomonas arcis]
MSQATLGTQPASQDATDDRHPLARFIDLERYPILQRDSDAYQSAVERVRQQLRTDGCALLSSFIRKDLIEPLREESEALAPKAFYSDNNVNPYVTPDDPSLPEDHPARFFQHYTNGFVARDLIPEDAIVQQLYRDPDFQRFVADCLEEPVIYEFADPIAGLVINVMPDDTELPWHFDTNEFIVSLMTRRPIEGGEFQYVPNIRRPGEENFAAVQRVLEGDHTDVKSLTLNTGDLQLFKGRYSMHRVAAAKGQRLCTLLGYAKTPDMMGSLEHTKRIYGRVTQQHIDADNQRRHDALMG